MKYLVLLIIALITLQLSAQKDGFSAEERAVKSVVDQFLKAAGSYNFDAMDQLFAKHANIGGSSNRSGDWVTFTMTYEEFKSLLQSEENQVKYTEPVSKYTIHISEQRLAFVKADAQVLREGLPPRTNYDYFTLIKIEEEWKILNGSYVSIPGNE